MKICLHGIDGGTTINTMIDLGATADFIDQEFCNKYHIKTIKAKNLREIYLVDSEPSSMGPVTYIARVLMDIGYYRELAIFQVVKLKHHNTILGMPWLRNHNPRINWEQGRITFHRERCTTWCLKESLTVYMILEAEVLEENLDGKFSKV